MKNKHAVAKLGYPTNRSIRKKPLVDGLVSVKDGNVTLFEKLRDVVAKCPEKYSEATIGRVNAMIRLEHTPDRAYELAKEFSDFELFREIHKEWAGKAPNRLENDFTRGGSDFVFAYMAWVRRQDEGCRKELWNRMFSKNAHWETTNGRESRTGEFTGKAITPTADDRETLRREMFPGKMKYTELKTLEDWKARRDEHPEWVGKTVGEMYNLGGKVPSFITSFYLWVRKQPEDERVMLKRAMFSRKYPQPKTIEDWKTERDRHPEWVGKTTGEMDKMGGKAHSFRVIFYEWVRKQPEAERKKLRREMFPVKEISTIPKKEKLNAPINISEWVKADNGKSKYSGLKAIEDWKAERDRHPEWVGKTVGEMQNLGGKAGGFVSGFYQWVNKQPEAERKKLRGEMFPVKERSTARVKADKRKSKYSGLNTIEDWKTERDRHPEWVGKGCLELQNLGGKAHSFRMIFYEWVRKQPEAERKKLRRGMFPRKSSSTKYSGLKTFEDWKAERDRHPEWVGKSATKMKIGGNVKGFPERYYHWVNKQPEAERKKLRRGMFPTKFKYTELKTINEWVAERNKHPEWVEKTVGEMRNLGGKAHSFRVIFYEWVRKQPEAERKKLRREMFPYKRIRYVSLKTLDDWKAEKNKHPEWVGKSAGEMQSDAESGARAFYQSFLKWVRKQPKEEWKRLRGNIFPTKYQSLKTIGDWKAERDKHPEWVGKGCLELQNLGGKAHSFRVRFYEWVRKQPEAERKKLRRGMFPRKSSSTKYSELKTFEDWKAERDRHPEWVGKTVGEMQNLGGKAHSFLVMSYRWVNKQPEADRKKLRREMFPVKENVTNFVETP